MPKDFLFTSESVNEGHPDKVCDQIADALLDCLIAQDPESRVAVECMVTTGSVHVAGEVTTTRVRRRAEDRARGPRARSATQTPSSAWTGRTRASGSPCTSRAARSPKGCGADADGPRAPGTRG